MFKIDAKYTGAYVTMMLFGAGVGLLVGSYIASVIESRKDNEEDLDIDTEHDEDDELEVVEIEEAAKVVAKYKGEFYRQAFEELGDEEDDISTKEDFAVAELLHNIAGNPRATPIHVQMVENGLVSAEQMLKMLEAADEVEDDDYDDVPWEEEDEIEEYDRYIIMTEKPEDFDSKKAVIKLIWYSEDEVLSRVTTDGREVNMSGDIQEEVLVDAADILTWSEGKQPVFIYDTDKNKLYSLSLSKRSLAPPPRKTTPTIQSRSEDDD